MNEGVSAIIGGQQTSSNKLNLISLPSTPIIITTTAETDTSVVGCIGGTVSSMSASSRLSLQSSTTASPTTPTTFRSIAGIDSPERKRLKVESLHDSTTTFVASDLIGNGENINADNEDLAALKRRILEHKYLRLRLVKEKYSEHVAELFFLQQGGNMMEYPTWRKKPQSPQFIAFSRQHRLDQSQLDEIAVS